VPPAWLIVRLPPAVRELTLRPAISSLKLPKAVLGTSPAIKLFVAGAQVGVSGAAPIWLAVEMTSVAEAEVASASKTTRQSLR